MEPPKTFTLTLRPYQKQALWWMSSHETGSDSRRDADLHPLWQQCVPSSFASFSSGLTLSAFVISSRWMFNIPPEQVTGENEKMLDIDDIPDG